MQTSFLDADDEIDLDDELNDMYTEFEKIDDLLNDLYTLQDSGRINGYDRSITKLLKDMYDDTSLSTEELIPSFESYILPKDEAFAVATEAVTSAISSTLGKWLANAAGFIGKIVTTGIGWIGKAFTKTNALLLGLVAIPAGIVMGAGDIITSYPMLSLITVASGVAAVPAVMSLVTRTALPASLATLKTWGASLTTQIMKTPLGKIFNVNISEAGVTVASNLPKPIKGTPKALGWAVSPFTSMFRSIVKLFTKDGVIGRGLSLIKNWVMKGFDLLKSADASLIGPQKNALGKTISFIWKMLRSTVTEPLGLLITAAQYFLGSISKIRKAEKAKDEDSESSTQGDKDKAVATGKKDATGGN